MKSSALKAGLFVCTIVHACIASAGPITTWQVDVSAIFDEDTLVWDDDNYWMDGEFINPTSLRWGFPESDGAPKSGLDIIDSPASAPVNTNGPAVANISVTHLNQPISYTALDSIDILSTLTLKPLIPAGLSFSATIPFHVNFLETYNIADPCANGGQNDVGVNSKGCADIFVIDPSSLDFEFMYPDLDGSSYLRTYQISFFELTSGLNPLSPEACLAVTDASTPCIGFETEERANTTFQFAARITTEIPEPTTLVLMSLGFAGFAYKKRRLIKKGLKVA